MIYALGMVSLLVSLTHAADELPSITLPQPEINGGPPLMQVLQDRKSTREFNAKSLPLQALANVLWAGFGANRVDGHRTAPSTMNCRAIDIYVALAEGTYIYETQGHRLRPVASGDIRARTGGQDFVKAAPVALIFVADLSRLEKAKPKDRERTRTLTWDSSAKTFISTAPRSASPRSSTNWIGMNFPRCSN